MNEPEFKSWLISKHQNLVSRSRSAPDNKYLLGASQATLEVISELFKGCSLEEQDTNINPGQMNIYDYLEGE